MERIRFDVGNLSKTSVRPIESTLIPSHHAWVDLSTDRSTSNAPGGLITTAKYSMDDDDFQEDEFQQSNSAKSSPKLGKRSSSRLADASNPLKPSSRPGSAKLASTRRASSVVAPCDGTRPALLLDMLQYVRNELKTLGAEKSPTGTPERLQVFKQAFSHFIAEFKTYQPILTLIKYEYDTALQKKEESIRRLASLKGKMSVLKFQSAREMDQVRDEALEAVEAIHEENAKLIKTIKSMSDEHEADKSKLHAIINEYKRRETESLNIESPEAIELKSLNGLYEDYQKEVVVMMRQKDDKLFSVQADLNQAKFDISKQAKRIEALEKDVSESISKKVHLQALDNLGNATKQIKLLESENYILVSYPSIFSSSTLMEKHKSLDTNKSQSRAENSRP